MKINSFISQLIVCYLGICFAKAQNVDTNKEGYRYVSLRGHSGGHAYTGNSGLKQLMKSGYGAMEVKFGWQTTEKHEWAKYYNYPSYGIGWYSGFLGSPETFGKPNAVYTFVNFPISSDNRRNVFNIEPSLGLTYNLEPYNAQTNPLNEAIGAKMAVYANLKFGFDYRLNREIDIEYGIDFTHFSNGRSFTPNYGLNMIGIHLGMKYHYNVNQRKINNDVFSTENLLPNRYKRPRSTPNYKEKAPHSINLYVAGGSVQTDRVMGTNTRYGTFSAIAEYQHKINNAHGLTAGFDYFFDDSVKENYPNNPEKRHQIAVHFGYDFMLHRFTIITQLGTYLNQIQEKEPYFFRPALRYNISRQIYTQIGLKANGFASDWVEFGVGFRPFRW